MRKIALLLTILVHSISYAQKKPEQIKMEFTQEVLEQKVVSYTGKKLSIHQVMQQYQGKIVLIDFWASWCRDCLLALPKVEQLKNDFPTLEFVYFSLDRTFDQWKRGLEKHGIADRKTYWFDEGWKNKFNNYIDLNWVPRFILVDKTGKIAHYYSISPDDPELRAKIQELIKP